MGYQPDLIQVNRPGYFARTSQSILANQSDATLQAYFMWKAIKRLAPWVGAEVTNRFTLRQSVGSIYSGNPEACIAALDRGPWTQSVLAPDLSTMSWALSRFYVERSFPPGAQNTTTVVVRNVQRFLVQKIQQSRWLSDAVKRIATGRINSVKWTLGFDDKLIDPLLSQKRMSGLTISDSNIGNALELSRMDIARLWTTLTNPSDGVVRNNMSPMTVDAQYLPVAHEIYVPAGMAEAVSREPVPAFAAYGYFGTLVGHEIGHIIDGRPPTMQGWDKTSVGAMQERIACIEKQYSNFTFMAGNGATTHVQGKTTGVENMADQHGLSASYAAWKDLQRSPDTRDLELPGLELFSSDQLFFLNCK